MVKAIALGSDHAGFPLKEALKSWLQEKGFHILDMGCFSVESVDYPDFAKKVCEAILEKKAERGILICGTGIGMAMMANRFPGIRAVRGTDLYSVQMARRHNQANLLTLGGRMIAFSLACVFVEAFLATPFEGGRHQRRVGKMDEFAQGEDANAGVPRTSSGELESG